MIDKTLRADCARCAALCCVSLSFERSALFAFDKDAGAVCPHLKGGGHHCGIHAQLEGSGFGGCARYDCLGAGQYVVQHLFRGRSWRDDPSLLRPMSEFFAIVRRVCELLALVRSAQRLALTDEQREWRDAVEEELELREPLDLRSLQSREVRLRKEVFAFLRAIGVSKGGQGGAGDARM